MAAGDTTKPDFICLHHEAYGVDIKHLKNSDEKQWKDINNNQKTLNRIYGAVILVLLGTLLNVGMVFIKG